MELTPYTVSKIEEEVKKFLFIKWLESDRKDWKSQELQELYDLYHPILSKQIKAVY